MSELNPTTEARILQAATREFLEHGLAGARTQAIADAAGVNKALLHYYYRTKEALHARVFQDAYSRFRPALLALDDANLSLAEKLEHFTRALWKLAADDPHLLLFITAELARGAAPLPDRFQWQELHLLRQLREGMNLGLLRQADPLAVLLEMLSLSLFPLQTAPLLRRLYTIDDEAYKETLRAYFLALPTRLLATYKR